MSGGVWSYSKLGAGWAAMHESARRGRKIVANTWVSLFHSQFAMLGMWKTRRIQGERTTKGSDKLKDGNCLSFSGPKTFRWTMLWNWYSSYECCECLRAVENDSYLLRTVIAKGNSETLSSWFPERVSWQFYRDKCECLCVFDEVRKEETFKPLFEALRAKTEEELFSDLLSLLSLLYLLAWIGLLLCENGRQTTSLKQLSTPFCFTGGLILNI